MARLITVSIDCRNEAARQTFEDIVSRRRDYLVTRGLGTGSADILLIELDELRPQETFGHIRGLLTASPELEVFLTASRTDPQVLLEAFRLGVKEFLPQPLTRQEVEPALARFEERFSGRTAGANAEAGTVVSVIGARGGVGTSTVATNLAISVQQARPGESVALVDLNVHGGDLGLFLDLRAAQGLKHLSEDVSRLDETIVRSTMMRHASGLYLLASGYEGFEETEPRPGSAMRVIGLLQSMHRHVVVDCGHVLEPAVKESLAEQPPAAGAPKPPVKKKEEGPKPTDAADHPLVRELRGRAAHLRVRIGHPARGRLVEALAGLRPVRVEVVGRELLHDLDHLAEVVRPKDLLELRRKLTVVAHRSPSCRVDDQPPSSVDLTQEG